MGIDISSLAMSSPFSCYKLSTMDGEMEDSLHTSQKKKQNQVKPKTESSDLIRKLITNISEIQNMSTWSCSIPMIVMSVICSSLSMKR